MIPTVKTKYLFFNLLKLIKPGLALDVGSMDGADSLRFRKMVPHAKIIAFEGNPYNFKRMNADRRLKQANIILSDQLVSKGREATFYVSKESIDGVGNLGSSSLRPPSDKDTVGEKLARPCVSLDTVIGSNIAENDKVALWVDVEGAAYEVLETALSQSDRLSILHVEVELEPRWEGQLLKNDVIKLCDKMGLDLIAKSKNETQQDLVFVNRDLLRSHSIRIKFALFITRFFQASSSRILAVF